MKPALTGFISSALLVAECRRDAVDHRYGTCRDHGRLRLPGTPIPLLSLARLTCSLAGCSLGLGGRVARLELLAGIGDLVVAHLRQHVLHDIGRGLVGYAVEVLEEPALVRLKRIAHGDLLCPFRQECAWLIARSAGVRCRYGRKKKPATRAGLSGGFAEGGCAFDLTDMGI